MGQFSFSHDERGAKVPTLLEGGTTSFVLRGEGRNNHVSDPRFFPIRSPLPIIKVLSTTDMRNIYIQLKKIPWQFQFQQSDITINTKITEEAV